MPPMDRTPEPSNPSADGQPTSGPRAQTLAVQGLVNRVIRACCGRRCGAGSWATA